MVAGASGGGSFRRRVAVYLVLAIVLFGVAELCFWLAEPRAALVSAQHEGRALAGDLLATLESTDFGQSRRGRELIAVLRDALARGSVIFATDLDGPGHFRDVRGGVVYVDGSLLRGDGPARDRGLVKVLFDEAVHALRTGGTSIEEECDGCAAGMVAVDAIEGKATAELIEVDGRPLVDFVRARYADLGEDSSYLPVGETRSWLLRRTGCCVGVDGFSK